MLLDTPTPSVVPRISGCLCRCRRGHSCGLALGPRPPSPLQPGWRPLDAAERLPHPAPTPPSSLTGGIAPGEPEIPPGSIETNPADPEHHLGGLSMRPAGRSPSRGTRGMSGAARSDAPILCAPGGTVSAARLPGRPQHLSGLGARRPFHQKPVTPALGGGGGNLHPHP